MFKIEIVASTAAELHAKVRELAKQLDNSSIIEPTVKKEEKKESSKEFTEDHFESPHKKKEEVKAEVKITEEDSFIDYEPKEIPHTCTLEDLRGMIAKLAAKKPSAIKDIGPTMHKLFGVNNVQALDGEQRTKFAREIYKMMEK